jgi:hypothetical protein
MTETELLKAQIKELERLVSLKDQTIAHLQSQPRYYLYLQSHGVMNGPYSQGIQQNCQNQQYATQGVCALSNVTLVGGSG